MPHPKIPNLSFLKNQLERFSQPSRDPILNPPVINPPSINPPIGIPTPPPPQTLDPTPAAVPDILPEIQTAIDLAKKNTIEASTRAASQSQALSRRRGLQGSPLNNSEPQKQSRELRQLEHRRNPISYWRMCKLNNLKRI